MKAGFRWCEHCGAPHALSQLLCPTTGRSVSRALHQHREPEHPLIGKLIDGKYRVGRIIGKGGFGIVFEAENVVLGRAVAVKIVTDTTRSGVLNRLVHEAKILAPLQHPNICDLYDVGCSADVGPYLVMERLNGETLTVLRRRTRRLPLAKAVSILIQLLSGLGAAHTRNIVHRDLKPENVFLVDRLGCAPLVKLLDFGLALDLACPTPSKAGLGTPRYMAPEQLKGLPITIQTDIFVVGVLAYELLTGFHPFHATTVDEIYRRTLYEEPPLPSSYDGQLPAEIDSILDGALAKDPANRFANALSMQYALAELQDRSSATLLYEEEEQTPDSATPH